MQNKNFSRLFLLGSLDLINPHVSVLNCACSLHERNLLNVPSLIKINKNIKFEVENYLFFFFGWNVN